MVAAASLANLQPAFSRGNTAPRRSREVSQAIAHMRKGSCKAVDYCIRVLQDENEQTALRLKAAIAILDKTIPDAGADLWKQLAGDENRVTSIAVHVVHDRPSGPTIDADAEPEQSQPSKITIHTVAAGSGDD